jgi:FkbM family methyltransferase
MIINKLILNRLVEFRDRVFDIYSKKTYSQEGEDMILSRIFDGKKQGFYVDIGAHHPRRFSNTYFFYKQGWTGINVEPNPDAKRLFEKERPKDINLQCGISECEGELTYYYFDEPALNTFDYEVVKSRLDTTSYKLINQAHISVFRLDSIFRKYLPIKQRIDFLTIDVEGLDFAVLRSNDWSVFRPVCIIVEELNVDLLQSINSEIASFLINQGYKIFARTYNSLIFIEDLQRV